LKTLAGSTNDEIVKPNTLSPAAKRI